jgi:hypothetical protein
VSGAVSRRSRLIAVVLLTPVAVVLAHYVQVWASTPAALSRTSDFAGTYVAATLWHTGHGADLYNEAAETRIMAQTGAPAGHLYIPFENPPAAAVVAAPLAFLDAATAYRIWSVLQLALLIAALWIVTRSAPWPERTDPLIKLALGGVALAGFGSGLLFVEGQWDGVSVFGLALAYASWRRGHAAAAGFTIGFTSALAKPHLAIGIAAFMLGRRDWRALAGAVGGGAVLLAFSLLAVGPAGMGAFTAAVTKPAYSPIVQMQGASGLFGSLLGVGASAYVLALIADLAAALLAGWLGNVTRAHAGLFEPALAGAVVLSLFAAPHLLGHDLTLLAPALLFGLAWAMRRQRAAGAGWPDRATIAALAGWLMLSLATMNDLGNMMVGPPGRLTPWVLLLLAAMCVAAVAAVLRRETQRLRVMHVAHHAPRAHRA